MYKNWAYNETHKAYVGTYDIVKRLPAGYYRASTDSWENPLFSKLDSTTEDIFLFENGPMKQIINEIDSFWKAIDRYAKMGVAHKRGFLLHGKPGCGKSGIISYLIQHLVDNDGIAIQVHDVGEATNAIKLMRQIE